MAPFPAASGPDGGLRKVDSAGASFQPHLVSHNHMKDISNNTSFAAPSFEFGNLNDIPQNKNIF